MAGTVTDPGGRPTAAASRPPRVRTAAAPPGSEFERLTAPYRRELLAHCYRMLGAPDEAEDLVQETYLRAWRSFDGFQGRSSLRVWLYRIATNACLTALEHRARRPLPSGLGGPGDDPEAPLAAAPPGVDWVRPLPDTLLAATPGDPETVVAARGSVRLALIAALQHLPARQRAVLILRDVLAWRTAEVADLLGTSTAAVKSLLQRARAELEAATPREEQFAEPAEPATRALLDRYMAAFENADAAALARLLHADAVLEMPPLPTWFAGREAVVRFLAATVLGAPGLLRLVPVGANGQPAAATYRREADGLHHAHALQVLTTTPGGVCRVVVYLEPGLFAAFGLPGAVGCP
ncbi:RNA polymerase subunit sigma-70 [Streptomyces sp. B1866]|uniref:RNA polymerase subunit sigma-70 n=1 Tax=Streptomyces sp. B1866 TaxID=3075431 RepID=UPI00288DE06C|nr:RNA polymerase subunit sigma-70 [Streptomyces sp. B1866]MDT3398963.1 RNA polymerase subunit sigma-70 [Streptomyces sp. B1866]